MTPTRPSVLVALVVGPAVLLYLLAAVAYGSLPVLPRYAAVSIVLLAVVELGMARVVRDRVQRRPRPGARPLHPEQVARAAALAKASSAGGALLLGAYAGLFAWTLPRRDELVIAREDAVVAGTTALACAALVAAALLLERSCRRPDRDDDLGSGR